VPFVEWVKAGKPSGTYEWEDFCERLFNEKIITKKYYDPHRAEREEKKEKIKSLENKIKNIPKKQAQLKTDLADLKRELKDLK
jgi:septal ring factor EnvC (AmiA/AmiB activator)